MCGTKNTSMTYQYCTSMIIYIGPNTASQRNKPNNAFKIFRTEIQSHLWEPNPMRSVVGQKVPVPNANEYGSHHRALQRFVIPCYHRAFARCGGSYWPSYCDDDHVVRNEIHASIRDKDSLVLHRYGWRRNHEYLLVHDGIGRPTIQVVAYLRHGFIKRLLHFRWNRDGI